LEKYAENIKIEIMMLVASLIVAIVVNKCLKDASLW
jgi:hypothetical protein